MKKMGLFLIVILMMFWTAITYGAVSLDLMGPTKFTRDKGKPDTKTSNSLRILEACNLEIDQRQP